MNCIYHTQNRTFQPFTHQNTPFAKFDLQNPYFFRNFVESFKKKYFFTTPHLFYIKMKKIILFLIVAMSVAACMTPEKLIYKGDYDGAIALAVRNLSRSKKKDKDVVMLERAFAKAQTTDLQRIELLRKEGQPSGWEEITHIYVGIKKRQNLVNKVTPLRVVAENRAANLPMEDVDGLLVDSKQNAANYMYARAQKLMADSEKNNDRMAGREAYAELMRIDKYYRDFKDKETLKTRAHALGESRVYFRMVNNSGMIMPANFERELLSVGMRDVDTEWLKFDTQRNQSIYYDYDIYMNIQTVNVTPEQQREREYVEERDIQDGSEPVLDGRGKPKRDSLGNVITRPRTRHVRAMILEINQQKMARVGGSLEFYDPNNTGKNGNNRANLLKTVPINADAVFQNYAATFKGDREALTPETTQKIGNRPQPFPSTPDLLMTAADRLKPIIKQAIMDQRSMLEGRKP
jgi:hypothetical protein